jgi:hypothetical protein
MIARFAAADIAAARVMRVAERYAPRGARRAAVRMDSRARWSGACIAFVACVLVGGTARGDLVDLDAAQDATLISEDVRKANGSGAYIFAGNTDKGDQRRALLQFDIAGNIPAGATINSVSLQLSVNRSQVAGDRPVRLRRILTGWSEGPSDPGGAEGGGRPSRRDVAVH